ncbi:MAG TPA: hypothetical protein PK109_02930 [Candidatus Paceibacterota bacterium]|nr:hypothetical protein [Candidatus Paceibacterota bacterium]
MSDFLKMDIFFFVATIGTIVTSILLATILFYGIRVLRGIERILGEVEEEAKALRADIQEVRAVARKEGSKLAGLLESFERMLRGVFGIKKRRSPKKKTDS